VIADRDVVEIAAIAGAVEDPELPSLTLADLGIFRRAYLADDGVPTVELTPTYSGCPAVEVIHEEVQRALASAGYPQVVVATRLAPAWTTDWITATGREKLASLGISPPPLADQVAFTVKCVQCGSRRTELTSRFSGTPCKALYRCCDCLEPFEAVKPL
jgi:ring-1,2-phenylacetyl-CoA epoxidase subunit PaaD